MQNDSSFIDQYPFPLSPTCCIMKFIYLNHKLHPFSVVMASARQSFHDAIRAYYLVLLMSCPATSCAMRQIAYHPYISHISIIQGTKESCPLPPLIRHGDRPTIPTTVPFWLLLHLPTTSIFINQQHLRLSSATLHRRERWT